MSRPVNNPTMDKTIEIYKEQDKQVYYVIAGGKWIGVIQETPEGLTPWTYCGQGVSLGGDSLEAVKKSVLVMLQR